MAVALTPSVHARNRYTDSFQSKIFEPLPSQQGSGLGNPAGRRRDQTTSELFGDELDKDLHSMPKTFEPKDFNYTAKQTKAHFLASEVLPRSQYPPGARPADFQDHDLHKYRCDAEPEVAIDPMVRRQNELSSELFGRETPVCGREELHDASRRLTPTDFKWFNIPQKVGDPADGAGVTHQDRSFKEKSSSVLDHTTVNGASRPCPREQYEEQQGDIKRKANVYYSDLFGRAPPMEMPNAQHRPKCSGHAEGQITVHGDWTDSRTEARSNGNSNMTAGDRKRGELHSTRLFDQEARPGTVDLEPVTTDNSHKLKTTIGSTTQQIHQAHLQSSTHGEDFYSEAARNKAWEVVELHIAGLQMECDDAFVRSLCQGFELHVVKIMVEMDPVRNYCKGRAKVMLRYNPERDSIHALVHDLEGQGLRVQM